MDRPFISIIIPAYNSASTLHRTIEACLDQDYPGDRVEIIVVDDGSNDDTGRIAKGLPVRYIYQDRGGPASARNNGWRNSKGEGLCFIDADCVPYKNWVSELVRHYYKENIGAIAGSYAGDGSSYLLDKFVHYEIRYRHSMMPEFINSFGTYNVLIKRSVFEFLDGFDPLYLSASGEDSDLSCRIIKAGYSIYFARAALVSHYNMLRLSDYIKIQFRHAYWRMRLYKKNASMVINDDYAYWKDFAELFLVLTLIIFLFLHFQYKTLILNLMVILLFLMQALLCITISRGQKDIRYFIFSIVTFMRVFVRVLGGIFGFIRFWIIKRPPGSFMG